ncbi:MAG: hypothetical protein WCQ49_02355 [Candidatus Saccharibacteria bacterium]
MKDKKVNKKLGHSVINKKAKKPLRATKNRLSLYLKRRPHRSFRRTRRRDYARSFELPGYIKFTKSVAKLVWENRKIFLTLTLVYAVLMALVTGMASQDIYSSLVDTIKTTSTDTITGFWGEIGKAGLLFVSTATGGLNGSLSDVEQVFSIIIILMVWMSSIWLLRNILAGHKVKLRDGLYNSSAPIISTFVVVLLLMIQLLPLAVAIIGYSAASSTGLLKSGVESMLFWFAAGSLSLISLYFITSTIFALIIVTLPGIYPFKAIEIAGDLVIGRRLRILLRLLWLAATVVIFWAITVIPLILFDGWIKVIFAAINWLPIIPVYILLLSPLTIIWVSSYIYLLYRKAVDDESSPA